MEQGGGGEQAGDPIDTERALSEPSNDLPPPSRADEAPNGVLTRLSPLTRRLIAPNASPFTFTGTCSYIVGAGEVAIIDPGPVDKFHMDGVARGGRRRASEPYRRHPHP